jgi:hypothetical protein
MNPSSSHTSPSALYRLDLFPKVVRNSQTIISPYLFDNQTNKCIVGLGDLWDASDVAWSEKGQKVSMKLRHCVDRSVLFLFEVDLETQKAKLSSSDYGHVLGGSIDGVVEEMARTTELRTIFY